MKRLACLLCLFLLLPASPAPAQEPFTPDRNYIRDRDAIEKLQRDVFRYAWEGADPASGMVYEANFYWDVTPVAVGGSGFAVAAIVTAADRGWITRDQALARLTKIVTFLHDKTPREKLHGAFPHWLNGNTGEPMSFNEHDAGADIVETSLLIQGLLIARAYFNGPGAEADLRDAITEIWEGVDWNFFTNGKEDNGIYWHWDPEKDFKASLRILGYNECLITYVLAMASPTHPISKKSLGYWASGPNYRTKKVYGYSLEATTAGGGPLFLAHYSFVGLDPHRLADKYVSKGFFVRNVTQTLSNRAYCLEAAPKANRYSEDFWGLTASQIKGGYTVNSPTNDTGTMAPTAAVSSLPYTPQYSMQVLQNLLGALMQRGWGEFGPYDAISLKDEWVSDKFLAIDQLPMLCMAENYRSGLLWKLFMADADVQKALTAMKMLDVVLEKEGKWPPLKAGFPEMVVTLRKDGKEYVPDACDLRRHPDTGLYNVAYWIEKPSSVEFTFLDHNGLPVRTQHATAVAGRNMLAFPQFMPFDDRIMTLHLHDGTKEYTLPIRLH